MKEHSYSLIHLASCEQLPNTQNRDFLHMLLHASPAGQVVDHRISEDHSHAMSDKESNNVVLQ
jgi:hypothetical protein